MAVSHDLNLNSLEKVTPRQIDQLVEKTHLLF